MPYKIVSEHEDGVTLKQIAAELEIDFSRGEGFYELVKKEKVSAKKKLVLFKNGKLLSDESIEVRRLCGLVIGGDIDIQPSNIPANHQLFVQSTSPNRKISEDAAVLFTVDILEEDENEDEEGDGDGENDDDDGEPAAKRQATGPKYAVKFDALLTAMDGEFDGDSAVLFNVPIGNMFTGCDEIVPEDAQKAAIWQLYQLFRVQWEENEFHFEIEDDDCYGIPEYYARASARGEIYLSHCTPRFVFGVLYR